MQFEAPATMHPRLERGEDSGEAHGSALDRGARLRVFVRAVAKHGGQRALVVRRERARVHLQVLHVHLRRIFASVGWSSVERWNVRASERLAETPGLLVLCMHGAENLPAHSAKSPVCSPFCAAIRCGKQRDQPVTSARLQVHRLSELQVQHRQRPPLQARAAWRAAPGSCAAPPGAAARLWK